MECNRDEAIRAKSIAEKKIDDRDFAGAKKFTLKAQTLYPELDGISQMLITINVYMSSENKVNGESDWYGVLGVTQTDDYDTIRKRYRKLALVLHPDKNRSVGANGAFKILSEAWSMLSDKDKRLAYNQRRNLRGFQQKVWSQTQSGWPSAEPGFNSSHSFATSGPKRQNYTTSMKTHAASVPKKVPTHRAGSSESGLNGFHSFANRETSKPKRRNGNGTTSTQTHPASVNKVPPQAQDPVAHQTDSFWTICLGCNVNYEFTKVYLNQTIMCPSCHNPFLAAEIPTPIHIPKPSAHHQNTNNRAPHLKPCGRSTANIHSPSRTKVRGKAGASKAADVVHDGWRRDSEEYYAQRPLTRRKQEDGA